MKTKYQWRGGNHKSDGLTERQTQVLAAIGDGLGTKEIAHKLNVSPKAIEHHRSKLYKLLGTTNMAKLVKIAVGFGLSSLCLIGLATSSGGSNKATISAAWDAVTWGRPVTYVLGVGTSPGVYSVAGTTSGTSYQYTGLQWQTLYYLSVRTMDSSGLQSPWSPWYHYQTGKPNHPAPQPPMPISQ